MNGLPSLPVVLGQLYWRPKAQTERVNVPCPACAGTRKVGIILGDGERLDLPCEGCSPGYHAPLGTIEEWVLHPSALPARPVEVVSFRDGEWSVRLETGETIDPRYLYLLESDALAFAQAQADALRDRNFDERKRKRGPAGVSKHAWNVRYHREQIKKLREKIAYHESKLEVK